VVRRVGGIALEVNGQERTAFFHMTWILLRGIWFCVCYF